MTKKKAVAIFGSQEKLAKFLKISQSCVSRWSDKAIPKLREYQLKEYLDKRGK